MSDPSFITCHNCQSERVSSERFCGQCGFERSRSGGNYATFPTEVPQWVRSARIQELEFRNPYPKSSCSGRFHRD